MRYGVRFTRVRQEIGFLLTFETAPFFGEFPVFINPSGSFGSFFLNVHLTNTRNMKHVKLDSMCVSRVLRESTNGK
jgi:hypothetical protein